MYLNARCFQSLPGLYAELRRAEARPLQPRRFDLKLGSSLKAYFECVRV